MAKNKITTGNGYVQFEWGDGSRTITVNPNYVYVSLFEDTLSFTLVGVPRPTGLSLFTTRFEDLELNGATFGSVEEALEAIQDALAKAGGTVAFEIVDELPASGNGNTFYLLRIPNPELGNIFEEYIWVENDWELVGSNGGSSIRTIYVGTSADSVDSGTCIINKVEGKKDWLNIVYADSDGYCNMTKINLNEFIIEGEFASGVTSLADGTVVGVVDPRQPYVHTEYDENGNPISSGDVKVLSVGESGFTVNNIQDAINAKVLIDRRLYTPNEGEYNKANQEITFKSDLDDELFIVDLSGDTALDSGSTNFVENSAITKAFEDAQDNIISSTTYVASSHTIEYTNRKDVKLFETVLDVDNDLDSGSTNPVVNSAVTEAINDLEERKADWVSAVTSGDVVATDDKNVLEFYNRSGATIFDIELPNILVDEQLSSGSSNPVANSAITEAVEDLEEKKADWLSATTSGVVITATSGNTLEYFNRSGDTLFKIELPVGDAVKGDENTIHAEINPQNEKVVSSLVYLKKITTGLPETVKERYQLVGADGNPYTTASGDTSANVDIYKDSHIVSITYITDSGDTHYQNLEYKYIDASGDTQTTYVDISEIIIEAEVGDGLEVDSHIIKGKIDPASEKVVTEYTSAGTSAQTEEVLTVGENGFKASNIQLAIDTKAEVNHKLYDVVNGVYEASSHTITFVSENDDLFDTELTFDNALNSGSANAVQNKVVKEEIEKRQIKNVELTQAEYDALVSAGTVDEETLYVIVDAEAVDTSKYVTSASITSNTSAYTISFSGESGELFDVEFNKGGDGKKMIEGTNIKITSGETADTIAVSASTAITSASTEVVTSKAIYDALELKQDKLIAGSGITITDDNIISAESGNKVIELTQAAYSALTDVDPDTFYIITDAEAINVSDFVTSGNVTSSDTKNTLNFYNNSGTSLFTIDLPNAKVDVDDELDSGSTNPVANSAITMALDEKLDKDYYVNQHYPKGSVLVTTTYTNPSTFIGGQWQLIGGQDADKNYYPAFAIATDTGKEEIDESLPNVTANTKGNIVAHNGGGDTGALSYKGGGTAGAAGSNSIYYGNLELDLSNGNSVYQDGAQVNVKAIKLFFWERIDDSEVIEPYTPLTCGSGVTIDNGVISSDWKHIVDYKYPQGSVYITYEYKNPSTWLGGEWELIGGEDENKVYWPALAIATDSAGTVVDESLPNIKAVYNQGARSGMHNGSTTSGGFEVSNLRSAFDGDYPENVYNTLSFDASKGQVDENGNYVAQSASTYQDGAQVAVESIKLFMWRRVDNATTVDSVVSFDFINTIDKDNPSTTKSVTEKGIVDYVKSLIIDIEHPVGSTYIQMAGDADPNTKYSGTTWVEDTSYDGRYFMVDSTNSAGTEIAESLPNIGGYWTDQAGGGNSLPKYGAFANSSGYGASCWGTDAGGKTSRVDFKASKGQLNASGGYVSEADSVYKNGASVHPLTVTIKVWTRTA